MYRSSSRAESAGSENSKSSVDRCGSSLERGILLLAANKGPVVLLCIQNRTKCTLLVSVMNGTAALHRRDGWPVVGCI
jgi:hypothetical protein